MQAALDVSSHRLSRSLARGISWQECKISLGMNRIFDGRSSFLASGSMRPISSVFLPRMGRGREDRDVANTKETQITSQKMTFFSSFFWKEQWLLRETMKTKLILKEGEAEKPITSS